MRDNDTTAMTTQRQTMRRTQQRSSGWSEGSVSVAVTAKCDATRCDTTRRRGPDFADPHILSMTGWLMAGLVGWLGWLVGWLAGLSVGRVGSRALPTGTCASVACSCRCVYARRRPPRPPPFHAYSSARSLTRAPLPRSCYSFSRARRERATFFSFPEPPRRGIESSRHGVRTYSTHSTYRQTEGGQKRKKRGTKRLEAGRGPRDSPGGRIELKGAREKGEKAGERERDREREKKKREGQNRVGRRFPIAERGPSRSDDDRKR